MGYKLSRCIEDFSSHVHVHKPGVTHMKNRVTEVLAKSQPRSGLA